MCRMGTDAIDAVLSPAPTTEAVEILVCAVYAAEPDDELFN